jgi:hypothetical protein
MSQNAENLFNDWWTIRFGRRTLLLGIIQTQCKNCLQTARIASLVTLPCTYNPNMEWSAAPKGRRKLQNYTESLLKTLNYILIAMKTLNNKASGKLYQNGENPCCRISYKSFQLRIKSSGMLCTVNWYSGTDVLTNRTDSSLTTQPGIRRLRVLRNFGDYLPTETA